LKGLDWINVAHSRTETIGGCVGGSLVFDL